MKKKILAATLLTVACGAGCAFGLAACGGGDNGGNNTPYITGIYVVKGNTDYGYQYDMGQIEYGTAPVFDYQVYAKFSNNTSEELTSDYYTLSYTYNSEPIDSLPGGASGYDLGHYCINIKYIEDENFRTSVAFEIVGAQRKNINIQMPNSWRYSQTQPTLTLAGQVSEIDQEEVTYEYISVDQLEDKDNPTEAELVLRYSYSVDNRIEPGEYYMVATVPASGKFATTRLHRKFTVNKGELTISETLPTEINYIYTAYDVGDLPLNDVLSSYYYTAKNHAGEDVGVGIKAVDENKKVNYSTHSGGVTEEVELNLNGYEDYYESSAWEATVTVSKHVYNKLLLDIHNDKIRLCDELDGGGYGTFSAIDNINIYYNGSLLEDASGEALLENPENNKIYTFKLELKDKDNHTWSDGTTNDLELSIITPVYCPVAEGATITVPVGTPVSALYDQYPSLVNEVGEWEFSMLINDAWVKPEKTDTIPAAGTYSCQLVFNTEHQVTNYSGIVSFTIVAE